MSLENAFVKAFGTTMMLDIQGLHTWIYADNHVVDDIETTKNRNGEKILPLVVIGHA